jgi:NAD-dependent oxidoreductase involved in siderophore biosynthesis
MELTAKQELFSQSVASGMTQADAYRTAYNAARMKTETIYVRACELMQNSKVAERVAGLRAETAVKHLWSREDSITSLMGVVKTPDRAADITSAVKELNAMHGYNAPIKNQIVDENGVPVSMVINVNFVVPGKK